MALEIRKRAQHGSIWFTYTSLFVNITTAIYEFLNTPTTLFNTFHSNTVVSNINVFLFVNMKYKIKIKLREFELQHNSFVTTLQIVWTRPHDTRSGHGQSNKINVDNYS